jgi:2-oxoglutarate dehydrogenase E2 component (dihydrolipoamide succinyltransferase)
MAEFQLILPKMGESVIEATILSWHKKPGDVIHENEIVLEVATDKVDSEVPSPVAGTLKKILFEENAVAEIGSVIAIIETDAEVAAVAVKEPAKEESAPVEEKKPMPVEEPKPTPVEAKETPESVPPKEEQVPYVPPATKPAEQSVAVNNGGRFYSPLVLNIARAEGISMAELESLPGSGAENRVTKEDMLAYVENKKKGNAPAKPAPTPAPGAVASASGPSKQSAPIKSGQNEIIEMDRMRKLIAKNMVDSRRISAHVSSFIEVDMTKIVRWREKHKAAFKKREGFNLTYMPVFAEAIAKAIKDYPMINISVDGDYIIKKKDINIGIATALPSGNLIVPVIKNADRMNLSGLAAAIHQLADKARSNKLSPSDIEGGTYSISNIGSFGNILGTPIIPQPQVAIMAVGAITKKPVVLETPEGDVIAIRQMMYLSHTYDHRVVDGALGGMFLKRVSEYLEDFDDQQEI